jgi:hypothetical protein
LQGFWEEAMRGDWHDVDVWREHQRALLREAQMQWFAQTRRPELMEHLRKYRRLLSGFTGTIWELGRRVAPFRRAFPLDEEVNSSRAGSGLVEAVFEERGHPGHSSSVIEFHQEGEGYVIREVDLDTGDHILYLSTEEPEWAPWTWERKTHG